MPDEPAIDDSSALRTYGGVAVADRRADRRRRFIDAAVEVFGTEGYATGSVTALCREAGLSRRQFYEEFTDREDLLIEAYDIIQSEVADAVAAALAELPADVDPPEAVNAAMSAFVRSIAVDSRRSTVVYVAVVGVSERVEEHRLQRRDEWATFILEMLAIYLPERTTRTKPEEQMIAVGFIGALTAVLHRWSTTTGRRPRINTVAKTLAHMLVSML
ncbi:MAG: helix-turn-helix domain-containing protein [Rhodococcus fascians]